MAITVAEFVWHRLHEWGLKRVYGYPGDGVGGLDLALERAKDTMEYVQVRHEEMAAFMASAHAKFTGEVGLCYATSGPGAIHLLNGLYDAKMDHVPVVAIVGQQARSALGAHYQQEVDLQSLFKDVAADFVAMASVPSQVRHLIDRAVRIASTKRTVTCVILPNDLQGLDYEDPPLVHGTTHTGVGYAGPALLPEESRLREAAAVLNAGKKVAILVGAGALNATDEVIAVAEKLQAGVAKALLGKAALPDDLPYVTGSLGLLGTKPSWNMMQGCDTFLMIGSAFPYSEFLPKPGSARGVQIDIDGTMVSLRYPMEVNLIGDSATTLRGAAASAATEAGRRLAAGHRERRVRMVEDAGRPRHAAGRSDQPPARILGAVAASSGQLHHDGRQRIGCELVCPGYQDPARHEGVAVGQPRLARRGDARMLWRRRWRFPNARSSPSSVTARCR